MTQFNKLRRTLLAAVVMTAACAMIFSCTKVDDTLGQNLIPGDQEMTVGHKTLSLKLENGDINPKKYFETRLFQTDSIISSNLTLGYMGAMLSDTFGLRKVGFLSQYTSYYKIDSGYFGYKPIFDSAQLAIKISSYGGDTTQVQEFEVFEVISNKYLTEKPIAAGKTERDTIFYLNFDPVKQGVVATEPLFSFTLGDTNGPTATTVTLQVKPEGKKFIDRLMLLDGKYKGDYSIYSVDSLKYWVEEFKGLYILPKEGQPASGKGALYATSLDASGLAIFGRNRQQNDPSLIKDTIGMVYYFYDTYAKHGNVSVNTIHRDYTKATSTARINIDDAKEDRTGLSPERPLTTSVYAEGLGGVVTELTFTEDFFRELEAIRDAESLQAGQEFKTMAFNQARILVYYSKSDYDWEKITNMPKLIEEMDASANRLGMYTNYKKLTGIVDYAYAYEQSYGTTLAYGGYLNRSRGCYIMDISAQVQSVWNSYLEEVKTALAEGRAVKIENIKNRSVFIGPDAYSLYTPATTLLQGMSTAANGAPGVNNAPIKIDLTYTMIK